LWKIPEERCSAAQRGSALHVNAPERLSGTPDQLIDNGRGGPDILDDACALARVVRQSLHIASCPSHRDFGTVAIQAGAIGARATRSPSPGRPGAAGRPALSHASTVLFRSARCRESGQPPSKTVAYTVLVSEAARMRARHSS